jgi:hypothetical protein
MHKCPVCGFFPESDRRLLFEMELTPEDVENIEAPTGLSAHGESLNRISICDSLAGRSIQIRKGITDGKWKAFLFPNGDNIVEATSADDPAAAIILLARKLQELPK